MRPIWRRRCPRWLAPTLALGLAACAGSRVGGPGLPGTVATEILREELGHLLASPPVVAPAPVPSRAEPVRPPAPARRHVWVTLTAADLPLRELLGRLSRAAGLTLVLEPEVPAERPVSLAVEHVSLEDALRTLLSPLALFARVDGPHLVIAAFETRSWSLSQPPTVTSWQHTITTQSQVAGTAPGPAAIPGTVIPGGGAPQLGGVVEVHREATRSDYWAEIDQALTRMVRPPAWFSLNRTAGLVTVRERPDRLGEIGRYLAAVEAEMGQQVDVEVKVLEVTLSGEEALGIDWQAVALGDPARALGSIVSRPMDVLSSVGAASAIALPFSAVIATNRSEALIRALGRQGRVRIVSQPRLLLANHQTAAIQVGQVRSYLASVTTTAVQGAGTQVSATVGAVQDGVTLTITPRILESEVVLVVTPTLARVSQIRQVNFGGGNLIEAPDVANRTLTTTVRVPSGGMAVLGGLLSEEDSRDRVGIPWLHRIPVLGWLFGATREASRRSELVVTLAPTIGGKAGTPVE
jgi:type IVB pilus formation R64 PilN family outer membrane protein